MTGTGFTAYLDTKTRTVSVYPTGKAQRVAEFTVPTATDTAARTGLRRRGFIVKTTGDYPYGQTFSGVTTK